MDFTSSNWFIVIHFNFSNVFYKIVILQTNKFEKANSHLIHKLVNYLKYQSILKQI